MSRCIHEGWLCGPDLSYTRSRRSIPAAPAKPSAGRAGSGSNVMRHRIAELGCVPNIPPKSNRKWKNSFSPYLYCGHNTIERIFGRLKYFHGIATSYYRPACFNLAAVYVASITYYCPCVSKLMIVCHVLGYLTTNTGHFANVSTRCDTPPRSKPSISPRPLEPTTMISALWQSYLEYLFCGQSLTDSLFV
jgi:hypothetical protein